MTRILAAAALAVRDDDGVEAPVQPVRDVAPHRIGDAAARGDAVHAVPARTAIGAGVGRRRDSAVPSDAVAVRPRADPRLVGVVHLEDDHGTGRGIGLSLVREVAELHGGEVWLEDVESGGTCVSMFLPDPPPDEGAGTW